MKLLLATMLIVFGTTITSAEEPYRIGIDGEPKFHGSRKSTHETKESPQHRAEIERILRDMEKSVEKPVRSTVVHTRRWVEDLYQPGLWYYGYYANVNGVYEFRFSRREYKHALSNFSSLYSVYRKYEVKTSTRPTVKVIYEPAY